MGLPGWLHDSPNKFMMADSGHIEYCNTLDEDICTKFGTEMQQSTRTCPRDLKGNSLCHQPNGKNSVSIFSGTLECKRYSNQMWYREQETELSK